MAAPTLRRGAWTVLLSVCTVTLLALCAVVVAQAWTVHSAASRIVANEASGVVMLHQMTGLLGEIVAAQSAAVHGETVDADGLRRAVAAVATADNEHGAALQTHQRLADLSTKVEAALAAKETGRAAYATYYDLVTLTLDLTRLIGDTSFLIHDPDLDSYYLMDSAIVRLPAAVVYAGRAADLVALAGGKTLEGEDAIAGAVARFDVSAAAEEVNSGLTKSVEFTTRAELGSNIADRLGTFKAAADAFAPPTMLADLATTVDSGTLSANARRVYAAATPLAHLLLTELQALLDQRASELNRQWRVTGFAAAGAVVVGLVMAWLIVFVRPRTVRSSQGLTDVTASHARLDNLPLGSLTYARELLDAEELAHAGRTAKPRTRGDGDAR